MGDYELVETLLYRHVDAWLTAVRELQPAGVPLSKIPLVQYYGIAVKAAVRAEWFASPPPDVDTMRAREVWALGEAVYKRYQEETAVDPN